MIDDVLLTDDPATAAVFGIGRLLAESETFQRRTESANSFQAEEEHIKYWYFDPNDTEVFAAERPFAAVWLSELAIGRNAAGLTYQPKVIVTLADSDRYPDRTVESAKDFHRYFAKVLKEMVERENVDDRVRIAGGRQVVPPSHNPLRDQPSAGAYWHVSFEFSLGWVS